MIYQHQTPEAVAWKISMVQPVAPQAIIEEARSWIGTPWRHQCHTKGAATDCAGLIRGVGLETGAMWMDPDDKKRIEQRYFNYAPTGNLKVMTEALDFFLINVHQNQMGVGDVLQIRLDRDIPRHLAILSGKMQVVHCINEGREEVTEHRCNLDFMSRTYKVWRYPGVQKWMNENVS